MSITNGDGLPIVFEMDLWSNIYNRANLKRCCDDIIDNIYL